MMRPLALIFGFRAKTDSSAEISEFCYMEIWHFGLQNLIVADNWHPCHKVSLWEIKMAPYDIREEYQPSGARGTCSPPATPHHLQNPIWPPGGPKVADGVWKGVYPLVFGRSRQLSLNKFFDPSTPSMRKVDNGKEKRKEKKKEILWVYFTSPQIKIWPLSKAKWRPKSFPSWTLDLSLFLLLKLSH